MKSALQKIKSLLKKEQEKYALSEESALEEICTMLKFYDIDMDTLEITENAENAGENILKKLIKYFRAGKLKTKKDEKGLKIIQTLENGTTIIYNEISAAKKRTMDKCETKEQYGKIQMFMGSLSNLGLDGVDKLNPRDLAVLEVLGTVFLLA